MNNKNNNKTLWMRWISFQKLRDLLLIVAEQEGELSPKKLYEESIKQGILFSDKGKSLSVTTAYHYRTILQRFGLIKVEKDYYYLNHSNVFMSKLVDRGRKGQPLSYEEKRVFANVIIAQKDCRYWFFDLFLPGSDLVYDLDEWIRQGNPISISGSLRKLGKKFSQKPVVIRSSVTTESRVLDSADRIQAVLWGLRLWCTEQLQIADELFELDRGYRIFPVRHPDQVDRLEVVKTILRSIRHQDEWVTLRVPDITAEWAPRLRISATELHECFKRLQQTLPGLVVFVPAPVTFITMVTPFERRDKAILNAYLHDSGGEYVSHIRLHTKIWEHLDALSDSRR